MRFSDSALFIFASLVMDDLFVEPLAVEDHSAPASHPITTWLARLPFSAARAPLAVGPARRQLDGRL